MNTNPSTRPTVAAPAGDVHHPSADLLTSPTGPGASENDADPGHVALLSSAHTSLTVRAGHQRPPMLPRYICVRKQDLRFSLARRALRVERIGPRFYRSRGLEG